MEEIRQDKKEEEDKDSDQEEVDSKVNNIYKGVLKCVEDYQGEVKHSKVLIKQVFIFIFL